jgi:Domain of unknown function (DUF4833)
LKFFLTQFIIFDFLISPLFGQLKTKDPVGQKFPTPPDSPIRLFYLQRSNNANAVIYDANLLKNNTIDANDPVHTYWIRYGEDGLKKELSSIQRNLAYGLHFIENKVKGESYEGHFLAYRKRKFIIEMDKNKKPIALFPINGKLQILLHAYVKVEEAGMFPKIPYIELFGKDPKTGADVYEKFKP